MTRLATLLALVGLVGLCGCGHEEPLPLNESLELICSAGMGFSVSDGLDCQMQCGGIDQPSTWIGCPEGGRCFCSVLNEVRRSVPLVGIEQRLTRPGDRAREKERETMAHHSDEGFSGPAAVVSRRPTVSVDFDGVIHSYTTPWINAHTIPDPPVDGAISWLFKTIQHFDVQILSTRAKTWRGRRAIRRWLKLWAGNIYYESPGANGIEDVRVTWNDQTRRVFLGKTDFDGTDLVEKRGLRRAKVTAQKGPALIYLDDRGVRFDGITWPTRDDIYRARPWWKPEPGAAQGRPEGGGA